VHQALRLKPLGIFLGDEAGVEVAGLEARVLHQRRLEGDVDDTPRMTEGVERVAHPAMAWSRLAPCTISLAIIES
jgi:hypothetical protein